MRSIPHSFGVAAIIGALCAGTSVGAQRQESTRTASDIITVVGCVQHEKDYRSQVNDGKGGVAGTGVGAANEFVLRNVRSVSSDTLKPTATTGSSGYEEVYGVTGKLEHELERANGHQVAVSGYVEVANTDATAKVKDLPRLNAIGWHTVAQKCAETPRR